MTDPDWDPIEKAGKWIAKEYKKGLDREATAQRTARILEERQAEREAQESADREKRLKAKYVEYQNEQRKDLEVRLKEHTGRFYRKPQRNIVSIVLGFMAGVFSIIGLALLAGGTPVDSELEADINSEYYVVQVDDGFLNVRVAPDPTASKLFELGNGDTVEVIKRSDNSWWHIKTSKGQDGWVNSTYLSAASE